MYAAAVGTLGLIMLQYFVDHLFPLFFASTMEQVLKKTLADVKNSNVRKLTLWEFSAGTKTPELVAARAFDFYGTKPWPLTLT